MAKIWGNLMLLLLAVTMDDPGKWKSDEGDVLSRHDWLHYPANWRSRKSSRMFLVNAFCNPILGESQYPVNSVIYLAHTQPRGLLSKK